MEETVQKDLREGLRPTSLRLPGRYQAPVRGPPDVEVPRTLLATRTSGSSPYQVERVAEPVDVVARPGQ